MRKALLLAIILAIIPANAVTINEPSFKFKTNPWLNDVIISKNGTFAVCYDNSYVYVFNASEILWKKKIKATSVDVAGKHIAVGDSKGTVYLFNEKGKLLWKGKIDCAISSIAVSENDCVIAGGDKEVIYFENGKKLWTFETYGCIAKVAISADGHVATAEDMLGNLYFFVKCSKDVCGSSFCQKDWVWEYRNGWYVGKFSKFELAYPFIMRISDDGNYILVNVGEMREIYVFDRFGYTVTRYRVEGLPVSVSTSSGMDVVAVGCDNGRVYVFDRSEILWKVDTIFGEAVVSVSPNGKFVAVGSGKKLVLFDRDGNILWVYDNFDDEIDFVSVSNDGRVVAGSSEGYVYFLRSKVKPDADFEFTPESPKVGEKVRFLAKSIADEYVWNFGDGKSITTNEPEVTHTYSKPGKYVVRLTVERDGMVNSTSKIVTVEAVNEPKENKQTKPTPKPKPTPTPTPKKSFPIPLPKIPGFEALLGLIAIAIALRKR